MNVGSLVRVKKETPYIWSNPLEVDDATSLGRFERASTGIILEVSWFKKNNKKKLSREVKIHVDGVIGWVSTDYLIIVE